MQQLEDLLKQLGDTVDLIIRRVGTEIRATVYTITANIRLLVSTFGRVIENLVTSTLNAVKDLVSSIAADFRLILAGVTSTMLLILDRIRGLVQDFLTGVNSALETIANAIMEFGKSVHTGLATAGEHIRLGVVDFGSSVERGLSSVGRGMEAFVSDFAVPLLSSLDRNLIRIGDELSPILRELGTNFVTITAAIVTETNKAVRAFAIEVVEKVAPLTIEIMKQTERMAEDALDFIIATKTSLGIQLDEIRQGTRQIVEGITATLADLPNALQFGFTNSLLSVFGFDARELASDVGDKLDTVLNELEANPDIPDSIKKLLPVRESPLAVVAAMIAGMALSGVLGGLITSFASPYFEIITQSQMKIAKPAIPGVAALIEAHRRGIMSETELIENSLKLGFHPKHLEVLKAVDKHQLSLMEVRDLHLRGELDQAQVDQRLTKLGFNSEDFPNLNNLFFIRPPVQDVIRMAVREVFTPGIAEQFGQFEDFPPEFASRAKEVGLREQDALNYWAAHWELPSTLQGFEMLHRRVIDSGTMDMLLRAQDVMPFWREKLTAIAYRPLTRVDVRRMHREDIIGVEEVFNAYLDIGYNEENAARMTDFTIAFNQDNQSQDRSKPREETKGEIHRLYKLRRIDREVAFNMLGNIRFTDQAANIQLDVIDYQREAELIDTKIAAIKRQFLEGKLNESEALTDLDILDVPSTESESSIALWIEQKKETHAPIPSKADFIKMFKKGILSEAQAGYSLVNRLGYSGEDAHNLIQLGVSLEDDSI